MDRSVKFYPDKKCDNCQNIGAWDFMGDYLCNSCRNPKPATPPIMPSIDKIISVMNRAMEKLENEGPSITMHFTMPQDTEQYELAYNGWKYKSVIDDLFRLIRENEKVDTLTFSLEFIKSTIVELLQDHGLEV